MQEVKFILKDAHQMIGEDMGEYISFRCPFPQCKDLEIRMDKETEQIKTVSGKGNKHKHTGSFIFRNQ